ncbi:MAG: hypothetical protein RLZZ129_2159 [Verrucomicrobiota bacterium]
MRPAGQPAMYQRWAELLFLHWAVEPAEIQRTLPAGLTVDVFQGRAWVGLVPFFMQGVRPRFCPAVPGLSDFLEVNVRTYVHDALGRPGVWFYSLDCSQWLAVKLARRFFHLPYEHARQQAVKSADGWLDYRSGRIGSGPVSRFRYRPAAPHTAAQPGTLEFFLVERYRLFAHDARADRLWTGRVAHAPYEIAAAEVTDCDGRLLQAAGFAVGSEAPEHICAARAVTVDIFPLERVGV